jgi:uncharacterized membrane protein YjjB (DUF3815 family)
VFSVLTVLQLGFGLIAGSKIVQRETPDSFENGCRFPRADIWGFLLLPIAAISFCIITNANIRQIPGMVLCCAVSQGVSFFLDKNSDLDETAIPLMAAACCTIAARLYSHFMGRQRPMVYIFVGILVLVPGSVGVRGATGMWGDNNSSMEFTNKMVEISVCIALGVFLALVPHKKWFRCFNIRKESKSSRALRTALMDIDDITTSSSQYKGDV